MSTATAWFEDVVPVATGTAATEEMKGRNQWVCWRYEERKGKRTKPPMKTNGRGYADSADPATWGTYQQARAGERQHGYNGVGFALGNGYAGVDFDDCRDKETGEILPEARALIADLGSYTEVSPSLTGVKVFVKTDKPLPAGIKKDMGGWSIEMYSQDRYFTVTGYHLPGTPETINDRTEVFHEMYERLNAGEAQGNRPKVTFSQNGNGSGPDLSSLNLAAAQLAIIQYGYPQGEVDRSSLDQSVITSLVWAGLSDDEIKAIFDHYPIGTQGKYAEKGRNGEKYLATCIANARAFVASNARKQAPSTGPDGEPAKGWTVALANAICEDNHFAKSEAGELHYYQDGRYHGGGDAFIERLCKETLIAWGREEKFSSYRASEVASYIAADAPELWTRPPAGKMNVQNGLLDWYTRELQPHSPEWLSTLQLPVVFDPEAKPKALLRFIRDWFPEDAQSTPWELLAWLICLEIALQKAALLLGNGANGKSRFLAFVRAFIGGRNMAALSLQQIETSRWATHHLNGKLANICSDLPADHLDTTSIFKALTGGDRVPAEKKHGEMYEYEPFVRLMFSANQPPQSRDASRAFFRRWIVIPFDATFTPEEKLPEATIDAMLASPEELSGALNMALDVLPQVMQHGITETESMRQALLEFHEVTDPVEVWLQTNTVEQPGAYVVKGDLAKAYNEAARNNGWPVLTSSQFGRRVKDWRPPLEDGQRRIGDSRPTVWNGLGMKAVEND